MCLWLPSCAAQVYCNLFDGVFLGIWIWGRGFIKNPQKLNMVEGQSQCQNCILKASVNYLLLLILWHYDILLVKGHYSFIIFHFS